MVWLPQGMAALLDTRRIDQIAIEDPNGPHPVQLSNIIQGLGGRTAPVAGGGINPQIAQDHSEIVNTRAPQQRVGYEKIEDGGSPHSLRPTDRHQEIQGPQVHVEQGNKSSERPSAAADGSGR